MTVRAKVLCEIISNLYQLFKRRYNTRYSPSLYPKLFTSVYFHETEGRVQLCTRLSTSLRDNSLTLYNKGYDIIIIFPTPLGHYDDV